MVTQSEIVLRLLLGTIIGGIIGYERQIHGRPAGFRTHILVCIASVLLMIVSEYYHYLSSLNPDYLRVDPGRIAAGAMTGVGFIGAGVVLKTGFSIQGLTTAACIWVVSAIGLSVGAGLYLAGVLTFLVTIVTLSLLRGAERKMSKLSSKFLTVTANEKANEEEITEIITKAGLYISNVDYERFAESGRMVFYFSISFYDRGSIRALIDELVSLGSVEKVSLRSHSYGQGDI